MVRLLRYDWPLHFVLWLTNPLPDNVFFIRLRGRLARPFFKSCGKELGIGRNVTFYNPSQMEIGDYVYIAYGCWFSCTGGIKIEDEVLFGPYVLVVTSNHTMLKGSYRFGQPVTGPIQIGKGAWIGGHAVITAGVTIGKGAVVAANSVANKDVAAGMIVGGVPIKELKQIELD